MMEDIISYIDLKFTWNFIFWALLCFAWTQYMSYKIRKALGKDIQCFKVDVTRQVKYVMFGFVVLFSLIGIIQIIYAYFPYILFGTVLFFFSFKFLNIKANTFNYNSTGFIVPSLSDTFTIVEPVLWTDVKKIIFDKDISQSMYGFTIYQNVKKPLRCWIERKNVEHIKEIFIKENVMTEQN